MDLPSERNRAANQDGPLLIDNIITHLSEQSQIIYGYFVTIEESGVRIQESGARMEEVYA
jgi:hypothetical protein